MGFGAMRITGDGIWGRVSQGARTVVACGRRGRRSGATIDDRTNSPGHRPGAVGSRTVPAHDHQWIQPTLHDRPHNQRRYTLEQFITAVADASNISDVCRALGLVPRGGNYESVRVFAETHGVDLTHLARPRPRGGQRKRRKQVNREELLVALREAATKAEALRRLGVPVTGTSYQWLNRILGHHASDPAVAAQVRRFEDRGDRRKPIETFLVEGRKSSGTSHLRRRLIDEGLLSRRCARCGRERWEGGPIPLELDHVNGDRSDNRLENLRLLCPNCHALTATYRGRNIGRNCPPG